MTGLGEEKRGGQEGDEGDKERRATATAGFSLRYLKVRARSESAHFLLSPYSAREVQGGSTVFLYSAYYLQHTRVSFLSSSSRKAQLCSLCIAKTSIL